MSCECGCGKPASIGRRFVAGHNMRGEDLTGRTFGNRRVLGIAQKKTQKENRKWLTKCVCGEERVVTGTKLLSGKSKGCRSCNNGNLSRPFEGRYNTLCTMAEGRCTVDLSYEEYLTFTSQLQCEYCGVFVSWVPHGTITDGHHLDRKDNTKGYSKKNCVVCCGPCNQTKSNRFTYEQMLQIGALIKSWRT